MGIVRIGESQRGTVSGQWEKESHCKFVNRGVPWGKKYFRKNDLAAVYRLDQNQRKQEGKRGHDNSAGLTWGQQGNRKEKKERETKKEKVRERAIANLFTG